MRLTTVLRRLLGVMRMGAALFRRGFFALFMGSFARECVSPVAISGGDIKQASACRRLFGSQPSLVTVPNTFGLLPDRRAPFWTFARRSGTVPWEGRQTCDGCDDRIPGTYISTCPEPASLASISRGEPRAQRPMLSSRMPRPSSRPAKPGR